MKLFEAAVFGVVSGIIAMEALIAVPAFGGDIFVRAGVALSGYDPVAYFTEGQAVSGSPAYVGDYQGATFRFASNDSDGVLEESGQIRTTVWRLLCVWDGQRIQGRDRSRSLHHRGRQTLFELRPRRTATMASGHSRLYPQGGSQLA